MRPNNIRNALGHLTRRQHMRLLALPNYRRFEKAKLRCNKVSRAALNAQPSERILKLYNLMMRRIEETKKRKPMQQDLPIPVKKAAMRHIITDRLSDLAIPKAEYLDGQRADRGDFMGPEFVRRMETMILQLAGSPYTVTWKNYKVYGDLVKAPSKTSMASSKKKSVSARVLRRRQRRAAFHKAWMETQTLPRPKRPPPPVPKRKFCPLEKLMNRILILSSPVKMEEESYTNIFEVKRPALTYVATERIVALAKPNNVILPLYKRKVVADGKVSWGALHYKITQRVNDLAAPKKAKIAKETDLKENAFSVKPEALKARCSARTKELAEPKNRSKK